MPAKVGGNPLSLRLAARLVLSDQNEASKKGIRDLTTKKWLLFQIDEELIQGQLYKRILDHIQNPDVRKLAHPGMVLRVVSPDIIMKVLAGICGMGDIDESRAFTLFRSLREEHGLVEAGSSGTLVYRPEIRQAMIKLLNQDKRSLVRDLNRAAVKYYEGRLGIEALAEEFYHRLVLNEDELWTLSERWDPAIERSIIANIEEYPERTLAWLATRTKIEVPREILLKAGVTDWERNITRKVMRAIEGLQLINAKQLLSERSERTTGSPLFALEAKTDILLEDFKSAIEILDEGIENVIQSNNRGRLAELYWLRAQVGLLQSDSSDMR